MGLNLVHILAHRGLWKAKGEQNTEPAFRLALQRGCGIETDFRDLDGEIVIAHDMARKGAMPARRFLEIYREHGGNLPLAVNIKADGLHLPLKALLDEFGVRDYFCFDMSVPDSLMCVKRDLRIYMRVSEIEPQPVLFKEAAGLWLDQFFGDWLTADILADYARQGKALALVSPELHKRPHETAWRLYKDFAGKNPAARIFLCTDLVDEALTYFA